MWPILWCLLLSNDNYLLNILSQPNQPQLNILSQPKQPQLNILSQPNQPQLDILSQSNQPQLDIFSQPNQPQLNILSQPNQPQHDILSQPKIRILPPPDKDFDKQRNGWDISPLCGIFLIDNGLVREHFKAGSLPASKKVSCMYSTCI